MLSISKSYYIKREFYISITIYKILWLIHKVTTLKSIIYLNLQVTTLVINLQLLVIENCYLTAVRLL